MTNRNKTFNVEYRFLSGFDKHKLHEVSLEAFSDYAVPINVTEKQFENHLVQNNIDIKRSVGAFYNGQLIGYTLNGFGIWNDKKTVYDGGTGVVPDFRRRGIGENMFRFMLPKLREVGIEQVLLEVITSNTKAVNLYRKLGFLESRRLLLFEQTSEIKSDLINDFEIRPLENPDWDKFQTFWDKPPSWQFSVDSVKRKLPPTLYFGAFKDKELIGYGILYPISGVIPQLAIDKNHRNKNIARSLLIEMQKNTENNNKLRFSNVDRDLRNFMKFAGKLNFTPTISQFEMILDL